MVSVVDLGRAIFEMTSLEPAFVFEKEQAGSRRCPWCRAAMATCRVVIVLEESSEKPRTTLDRCGEHGIWCDEGELAQLFEKVAGKGFGGGGGRTFDRPRAPASRGGWSAVFKIGGARGGWG